MTGYMASAEQAQLAASIIQTLKHCNRELITLVDPVMGDHAKLYVPQDVARAIIDTLIPLADVVTPNLWELSYIRGKLSKPHSRRLEPPRPCTLKS